MSDMSPIDLLKHYETKLTAYAHLAKLVSQFLAWRIHDDFADAPFPVLHDHRHREKAPASLKRNLESKRYPRISLDTITDLAGARLIFYFKEDLDEFIKRHKGDFERWFGTTAREVRNVQGSKMPDRTRRSGPGYQSYHVIVRVTPDTGFYNSLRRDDRELLADLYCEVQLRTILKHAWAEAEHDLRYKVENLLGLSLPQRRLDELFNSAASIDAGEGMLSQCKHELAQWIHTAQPSKIPVAATPKREPVTELTAFRHDGVAYPYALLDDASGTLPILQERADIFSVDKTMQALLKVSNYKNAMWTLLRAEEPQFIASVDHDSLAVRVCGWEEATRTLKVQPAYYSDQAVTNHKQALNKSIPGTSPPRKVRSLSRDADDRLLPFEQSPMANTLGVCCAIRVERSGHWVIGHRSSAVAFDPGKLGCPASGALEWTELGYWVGRDFVSWCAGGMARELEEEIGYRAAPGDFAYLGLAREFPRAGKPQLFFLLDLPDVSFLTVRGLWTTYTAPKFAGTNEFTDLRSISTADAIALAGDDEKAIGAVTRGNNKINEELRMNLALALKSLRLI